MRDRTNGKSISPLLVVYSLTCKVNIALSSLGTELYEIYGGKHRDMIENDRIFTKVLTTTGKVLIE